MKSPNELPDTFKAMKAFSNTARFLPMEAAPLLSKVALRSRGNHSESHLTALLRQLSKSDASFLRWACQAVMQWNSPIETGPVPIYQIHGENDFVIPAKNTLPDITVPGAGHALSMSHPQEVTAFIQQSLCSLRDGHRCTGKPPA